MGPVLHVVPLHGPIYICTFKLPIFVNMQPGLVSCSVRTARKTLCGYLTNITYHGTTIENTQWMDGWMVGCVGEWVDGWMGGWMDGWKDGWVDW